MHKICGRFLLDLYIMHKTGRSGPTAACSTFFYFFTFSDKKQKEEDFIFFSLLWWHLSLCHQEPDDTWLSCFQHLRGQCPQWCKLMYKFRRKFLLYISCTFLLPLFAYLAFFLNSVFIIAYLHRITSSKNAQNIKDLFMQIAQSHLWYFVIYLLSSFYLLLFIYLFNTLSFVLCMLQTLLHHHRCSLFLLYPLDIQ